MQTLNSRGDLFQVELPRIFIPVHIKKLYEPYVYRMPTMIKDISDLVNHSIQSITIPAINYDPIEQIKPETDKRSSQPNRYIGKQKDWRSAYNIKDLMDRRFSITFQLLDGFVNYWILMQTLLYYYDFINRQTHIFDIPVRIMDAEGNVMFSVLFHDVLFHGMTEFTISYSDNSPEFSTFDCNFAFNEMIPKFEVD